MLPTLEKDSTSANNQELPQSETSATTPPTTQSPGSNLSNNEPTTTSTSDSTFLCGENSSATPVSDRTLSDYTPQCSKNLQPITLFSENVLPSELQEDLECGLSNGITHQEDGDISVDFNLSADDVHPATPEMTLQSKTAKLIHRAVGDCSNLSLLDNLRLSLKEKQEKKGKKPSEYELQQYKAKLYLQVCSLRRETKSQLSKYEQAYYRQHGNFPDRTKSSEYDMLRKKYDFIKKLIYSWDSHIYL